MGDASPERKQSGCGLLNAVFGRRSLFSKRAASYGSISTMDSTPNNNVTRSTSTPNSRRQKGGSDDVTFASIDDPRNPSWVPFQVDHHQKIQNKTRSNGVQGRGCSKTTAAQGYVNQGKRVPKDAVGISGELESMIVDHQKAKGSSTLVRASSSNVMLYGDLGNLRQPANSNPNPNPNPNPNRNPSTMLNGDVPLTKHSTEGNNKRGEGPTASLCRGISTRMDPEQLKIMGNEDYKNGRFAEALALYEAAIALDPNKAAYRSNKSAALTALGRLLDALFECKEAILIEPRHHRAHNRMATLYVRLGEAENAIYHYKLAGPDADPDVISRAKAVQAHLQKCADARRVKDWSSLIRESGRAISAGADSAPQIFALQAEAFLKLCRHDEAVQTLSNGPNFEVEACTKFLGPIGNANLLAVRAQVDMAAGRFDDAVEAAQRAAQLDPNNKEVNMVLRKSRAVAMARSKGNELFKVGRFDEASAAYGEGLQHEPYNSVLLCNRAACRSKLGQLERAIEDCNAALNVRSSYRKAMLRRADCNSKLGKWEASIHDYEVLIRDSPDDEEVSRALSEAKLHLKRQRQARQTSENGQ